MRPIVLLTAVLCTTSAGVAQACDFHGGYMGFARGAYISSDSSAEATEMPAVDPDAALREARAAFIARFKIQAPDEEAAKPSEVSSGLVADNSSRVR